jgi:hypothetical protein
MNACNKPPTMDVRISWTAWVWQWIFLWCSILFSTKNHKTLHTFLALSPVSTWARKYEQLSETRFLKAWNTERTPFIIFRRRGSGKTRVTILNNGGSNVKEIQIKEKDHKTSRIHACKYWTSMVVFPTVWRKWCWMLIQIMLRARSTYILV